MSLCFAVARHRLPLIFCFLLQITSLAAQDRLALTNQPLTQMALEEGAFITLSEEWLQPEGGRQNHQLWLCLNENERVTWTRSLLLSGHLEKCALTRTQAGIILLALQQRGTLDVAGVSLPGSRDLSWILLRFNSAGILLGYLKLEGISSPLAFSPRSGGTVATMATPTTQTPAYYLYLNEFGEAESVTRVTLSFKQPATHGPLLGIREIKNRVLPEDLNRLMIATLFSTQPPDNPPQLIGENDDDDPDPPDPD